jgi:hypothetical protein
MEEKEFNTCLGCDSGLIFAKEIKRKDKQAIVFRCWCMFGDQWSNAIPRWRGRHAVDYERIKECHTQSTDETSQSSLKGLEKTKA